MVGAAVGAAFAAIFSLTTTGKVNAEDVALGAAVGAVPELGFVTAKDENELAVPGVAWGLTSAAPEAAALGAPVVLTVGGVIASHAAAGKLLRGVIDDNARCAAAVDLLAKEQITDDDDLLAPCYSGFGHW
jgi:hypothetical protein